MRRIAHFSNPVDPAIHLSKNLLEKFSDNSLEHGAFLRSNGKVTKISVFPSNHLRVNFSESPPCVRPWQGGAVCGLMCWRRDLVACVGRLFWILPESEYLCVMKTNRIFVAFSLFVAFMSAGVPASAQSLFDEMLIDGETVSTDTVVAATQAAPAVKPAKAKRPRRALKSRNAEPSLWDLTDAEGNPLDPEMFGARELVIDSTLVVDDMLLAERSFLPLVFSTYSMQLPETEPDALNPDAPAPVELNWAERAVYRDNRNRVFMQKFMVEHPELVRYNLASMPRPPKEFHMEADPSQAKITVTEFTRDVNEMVGVAKPVDLGRINWLHNFDGSLQFSQAYISPNWYQGGKSNLNAILNLFYDIKLNQAFHPNLIFETSVQYKLGLNNAPEDTLHAYNISEDLFQVNTKFGLKAAKRWYYSVTAQFKTQLLNSYRTNSEDLIAAFLSPSELNLGVGMTYNYENPKKTLNFTAAISPLSYNLKTCTNSRLNPTAFGIEEGHQSISQYGSSAELTLRWKLAYNIEYFSRLFMFTDYEYVQGDWENTITFNINKFLSTKIFAHLRYQSDALPMEDTSWHKWQFKEILSIGFSYRFSRS